jgi:superfamily II DNA or RNA helicase
MINEFVKKFIKSMSIQVDINTLKDDQKRLIIKELHFKKTPPKPKNPKMIKKTYGPIKEIVAYRIDDTEQMFLPFYFAKNTLSFKAPLRDTYQPVMLSFSGSLREGQKLVKDETLGLLNSYGSVLLALHVGFGKSILSLYLATLIRMPTIIIVHRIMLIEQWIDSIKKNFSGEVRIGRYDTIDEECDICVINVTNIPKVDERILSRFGLVIVDECHLISTEHFSKSLQYLLPRYVIGLSATPYRNDGMDKIMDLYLGKERIVRSLRVKHTVYHIKTKFEPPIVLTKTGQVDWGKIIEAQSSHTQRNQMIVDIACHMCDRHILILCKRCAHVFHLYNSLVERGERVAKLSGSDKEFDKGCRILIGTTSKIGVGFDFNVLDTLIVASDIEEYYIQYLGRIFRRPDVEPIIFDIVDKNSILKNHFRTRKTVYQEIGGDIKKFEEFYPELNII